MKKLLIALPAFGGGGAEKVMMNLANNFNQEYFDIYFLVLSDRGAYKGLLSKDIHIINLDTERVRNSRKKLIQTLNKIEPDIIFSTHEHLNILLLSIKNKISSKPKIYIRLTNTISQTLKEMSKLEAVIWQRLINHYYPKADQIIAQCHEMQEDFLSLFEVDSKKIKYIYNPLNLETIKSSITSKNPYNSNTINFLGVGRLTHQKGFDTLLKSFAKVVRVIPNSHLTILGIGELEEQLRNLAKELNIDNHVHFKGFVNNPYDYYYYSDVYVLSSRFEGFPNSLLEALACGTQVVSTSCKSGPSEIIKNKYGVMADVDNVDSLAKAMVSAFKSPNLSDDRADFFELDKITKEYEAILLSP